MSGWKITPEGVESVLLKVGTVAGTLSTAANGLPASAESALAGTAQCPIIGDALMGFFEHHGPTLQAIGDRINSSVTGAVGATEAYLLGDEEMAAEQQAAAVSVAGTGQVTAPATSGAGGVQAR